MFEENYFEHFPGRFKGGTYLECLGEERLFRNLNNFSKGVEMRKLEVWSANGEQATEGETWAIGRGAVQGINLGTITTLWDTCLYYPLLMREGAETPGNE